MANSKPSRTNRTSRIVGDVEAGFAEAGVAVSQGLFLRARQHQARALERSASRAQRPRPRPMPRSPLPRYIPVRPDIDRGVPVTVASPVAQQSAQWEPRGHELPLYIPVLVDLSSHTEARLSPAEECLQRRERST